MHSEMRAQPMAPPRACELARADAPRGATGRPRALASAVRGVVAGMVATAGALAALAGPGAAAEPPRSLRVVTFNMLHGGPASGWFGDGQELARRLEIALAELRGLRPDVIALQEASEAWGRGNVARRLAERLGYHVAHAPATERVLGLWPLDWLIVRAINFREGPAILSRFPIASTVAHDLPRCERRLHPRVLLAAELTTPWGPLRVYSTHTSRDDCQLRHLETVVEAARGPLPSLVMGDLNAGERAAAIVHLSEASGWVDAWRAAHPEAPGATVWQRVDAPGPTAVRRVDYVFLVPGRSCPGRVVDSRVVLNTPYRERDGRALWPSDHYGVLVDLELAAPSCATAP
jgi:endonuclease/exonuclease/phosphatase family metal-dependent hydrolase